MFQHTCAVGLLTFSLFAGELPKELGDLVNLTFFDASQNKFQGESCAPTYMPLCILLTFPPCFAGELPKELGQLVNLKWFDASYNSIGGELYVPSYMRRTIIEICHPKMACIFHR